MATKAFAEVLKTNPVLVGLNLAFNPNLGATEVKTLANFIRIYDPPLQRLAVGQLVMGDDLAVAFAKVLDHDCQLRSLHLPRNR